MIVNLCANCCCAVAVEISMVFYYRITYNIFIAIFVFFQIEMAGYMFIFSKYYIITKWGMYVFIDMIGKGQIAQKRPYYCENRFKSEIKVKYKYLVVC